MGKTLSAYFKGWDRDNIAQLYIHAETPTDGMCANYYRITDKEAIRSIVTRKSGDILNISSSAEQKMSNRTVTCYQRGRRRTPAIYLARNLWWKLSAWKTKKLLNWVDAFSPDAIFFASGDYAFMYRIALALAKYKRIPLFVSCMDDYYLYNKNANRFLGKSVHAAFMRQVNKTMNYASAVFCICDSMTFDYDALFHKNCVTLHTPASFSAPLCGKRKRKISYIGNLGYDRHLQLAAIGRALKKLHGDIDHIDVYSTENRQEILACMTEENGILFHGSIPAEEVKEVMAESLALIHTESFDERIRCSVKYSVSTKIADSLMSGTCLLAYGPSEVASIEYLQKNNAAYCITDETSLLDGLSELIENEDLRKEIEANAVALAQKNHHPNKNSELVKSVMEEITV